MEIKSNLAHSKRSVEVGAAEKQLKDVASLYEKQFLREMVKQMRATVGDSEWMPAGFAEKFYREQLDQQYVEQWGDQGGIGLGKLIYDQLIDRYGAQMGLKVPEPKAQGPLPISQRDQWSGRIQKADRTMRFERQSNHDGKPTRLDSPWDGRWLGGFELPDGQKAIRIEHDGVRSMLVGRFEISNRQPGDEVKAGEQLVILNPDTKSFLWRLE